jgi:hypothetical protein
MAAVILLASARTPLFAAGIDYEQEPIRYSETTPENAVSRLEAAIVSGEAHLAYDEQLGWLPAVLQELGVPSSSQTLVYSKTSMQRHRISPRRPRALYFNDDVYVGYCQGGEVIEVSVSDPQLGTVFYTLDQETQERPKFSRQGDSCLICHGSTLNDGFPSHLLRSVYADAGGMPVFAMGTKYVDQTTPFQDRWGGWYVSGTHGDQKHLGNLIVRDGMRREQVDNAEGQNVTDLSGRFDADAYLTPHSDIVALLVLEHQAEMHNRITQLSFQTRLALWQEASMKKILGKDDAEHLDSTVRRIQSAGDDLLEYMLFCEEAPLTAKVQGTAGFEEEFSARGPRDGQARSLRDFDLEHRLFRYPCSYLLYSEVFDALPDEARKYVLERLWAILTGRESAEQFSHLSPADRLAILEIITETKSDLPACWQSGGTETEQEQSHAAGG